jgi:hypothetical protein
MKGERELCALGAKGVAARGVTALRQNDLVANIELLAVNAVSDLIARCSLLEAEIASNDKTPITDGHIDVYSNPKHNNSTLLGRVSVQVKGRSTNSTKQTPSFSIDRNTLKFFRNNGGGVYFYVQVRKDLETRIVFFVNLNPFRIDRMLNTKSKPASLSFAFQKLPEDPTEIEKIFELAVEQQKQGKTEGVDEQLLKGMRGITVHTLGEISTERPTVLNLAENDFAVTIETEGGMKLPFDMDLTILPSNFVPREVDTAVRCGIVEYFHPTVWQSDDEVVNIQLSDGLGIRARSAGGQLNANIDLSLQGSLRDQLRDMDFFLAAARGEPLVIGGASNKPENSTFAHVKDLESLRNRIGRIVELFDALGVDDGLIGAVSWSDDDKRTLLKLHRAIVLDEDVAATSDGYGRLDITVGSFKIVSLVAPGSTPERLRITNSLDPTKRERFQLFGTAVNGSVEEVTNATVYESFQASELPDILNLHPASIIQAYDALDDRNTAYALANQMVLTTLSAADSVDGTRRRHLLACAEALSKWLVTVGDDAAVYKINNWQTRHRLGLLSVADNVDIRTERRSTQKKDGDDARLREACLSILLNDFDELDLILNSLATDQVEKLHSWPIWELERAK